MSPTNRKSCVGDTSVTGSTPVIARLVTVVTVVTLTFIKINYFIIIYIFSMYIESCGDVGVIGAIGAPRYRNG